MRTFVWAHKYMCSHGIWTLRHPGSRWLGVVLRRETLEAESGKGRNLSRDAILSGALHPGILGVAQNWFIPRESRQPWPLPAP